MIGHVCSPEWPPSGLLSETTGIATRKWATDQFERITAVYEAMLPRQPLHFLLADDPGAGKTIMTGLPLKELIVTPPVRK